MAKFKIEKRRMMPEYDPVAMEKQIQQHNENARVLDERAEVERSKARSMERLLTDLDATKRQADKDATTDIVDG